MSRAWATIEPWLSHEWAMNKPWMSHGWVSNSLIQKNHHGSLSFYFCHARTVPMKIEKNRFFFQKTSLMPRFFVNKKPLWGVLSKFPGQKPPATSVRSLNRVPEPIWSKWLLTTSQFKFFSRQILIFWFFFDKNWNYEWPSRFDTKLRFFEKKIKILGLEPPPIESQIGNCSATKKSKTIENDLHGILKLQLKKQASKKVLKYAKIDWITPKQRFKTCVETVFFMNVLNFFVLKVCMLKTFRKRLCM